MHAPTADDVRTVITSLCRSGLESGDLRRRVLGELRRIVPIDAAWFATVDPATLLFTSSVSDDILRPSAQRFVENELLADDVNHFVRLARRASPAATLLAATDDHLDRSERYREILAPLALGDELRVVLRSGGSCWGFLCLHRGRGHGGFSRDEVTFVERLSSELAVGLRTSLLVPSRPDGLSSEAPGLVIIDGDGGVSTTPAAEVWLRQFPDYDARRLPEAILGVASRVRVPLGRSELASPLPPRVRVQTRSGRWLVLHAAPLTGGQGQVAVFLEEARPSEIAPLILDAFGLTKREGEVVQLLALGHSTAEIGAQLHITEYTVQDHLKSVFDKAGVRSRRELIAAVFMRMYMPNIHAGSAVAEDGWFTKP